MDVLAGFQPRAYAALEDIASLVGLPGKMGMDGGQVWDSYRAGGLDDIRRYCETDVLNTYLQSLEMEDIEDPSSLLTLRSQMRRRIDLVVGGDRVHDLLVMEFVVN